MFAVIRQYQLNPIFESSFLDDWHKLVNAYRKREGLVSASIHKETPISFISYEKWKSRDHFLNIMDDREGQIRREIETLRNNCNNVYLLHSMELVTEEIVI
ncbi:MAG: antibiotic biosynthesis monooxygenase [Cryomorphaceae bacterium]|nr:antibiotic biosynthesis monooxygenase [Cryomorphaceae bacterium]